MILDSGLFFWATLYKKKGNGTKIISIVHILFTRDPQLLSSLRAWADYDPDLRHIITRPYVLLLTTCRYALCTSSVNMVPRGW